MQTPWYAQLLLVMENLYVVAAMTLVVIVLRLLWAKYRRAHPLPIPEHAAPPKPFDPILEVLEMALFLPAVALFLVLPVHPLLRTVGAVGGYIGMTWLVRRLWKGYRAAHPLPVPAGPVPPKGFVLEILDTLIIALVLVFGLVRPFMMSTYYIPSGSMMPTLMGPTDLNNKPVPGGGDRLIANRFVYRVSAPQRGDIVVFDPPREAFIGNNPLLITREFLSKHPDALTEDELTAVRDTFMAAMPKEMNPLRLSPNFTGNAKEDAETLRLLLPEVPTLRDAFIKRVIGVPGDHIRMSPEEGILVNGAPLAEPYLPANTPHTTFAFPSPPATPSPMPRLKDIPRQVLVDGQPQVLATSQQRAYYAEQLAGWLTSQWYRAEEMYPERIGTHVADDAFIVPDGHYLLLGDNRTATGSFDGRYWGVVPRRAIKGRAVCTFWPFPPFAPWERLKNLH